MPLTLLPGEGIELPLSEYNRLRAFQGGGWFWDHENQQVIREMLGGFLPRVEERSTGRNGGAVAFFQHFAGGTEAAGQSEAAGAQMNRVPRSEYQRLQRALEALKSKAQNPHTDPNARRIIEKFCLPDPAQNPELYRLHGSAWNRRLLVLWGCEREQGTSLAPEAALHKISVEPPAATFLRRLPLLLGLCLLLLLLVFLAYHFWPVRPDRVPVDHPPNATTGSLTSPASTPDAAPSGGSVDPAAKVVTATTTSDPADRTVPPSGTGGIGPLPVTVLPDGTHHDTSPDLTSTFGTANQASSSRFPGAATPSASPDGTRSSDSPLFTSDSLSHRGTPPSSTAASLAPPVAVSPAPAFPSTSVTLPPSTSASNASPTPPTLLDQAAHQVPLPVDHMKPRIFQPALPSFAIFQEGSLGSPHDGKMDVVLSAHATADGMHGLEVTVTRWTVDGSLYQDHPGHNATSARLPLTLTPGLHQISVVGTVQDKPVAAQVEVNVQIKSQGDVTVKPGAQN